jgi:hypothetical protein
MPRRYFLELWIAIGTCSSSSFLDASSMASSWVLSPMASSLLMSMKASGLRIAPPAAAAPAPDHRIVFRGNRGVAMRLRMKDGAPVAKRRVAVRVAKGALCRIPQGRHWRPSQKADLIVLARVCNRHGRWPWAFGASTRPSRRRHRPRLRRHDAESALAHIGPPLVVCTQ